MLLAKVEIGLIEKNTMGWAKLVEGPGAEFGEVKGALIGVRESLVGMGSWTIESCLK